MLEKLDKLANKKEVVGSQTIYHFNKGLIVKNPKVNDIFFDIIKDENKLILLTKDCDHASIIPKEDYPNTEIHIGE